MTFGTVLGMPPGHQAVIFDKSAFQSLSRKDHGRRQFRFTENITPVLLREILTDLTKADPKLKEGPDGGVQLLARKFVGSGGVVNAECRKLLAAALLGQDVEGDGRPIFDDYSMHREPDGTLAMLVDLTEANRDILRWARAEFSEVERRRASGLRAALDGFSVEALRGRLRQHHVLVPRPKTTEEIARIADDMLGTPSLQRALLDWLHEQLGLPRGLREQAWHHWESRRRPLLGEYAPYAHHCTRVLLILLIGTIHKKLTNRPTDRIDAEYLFYSPYCELFVSDDRFHKKVAPMVLWPGQRFLTAAQFACELPESLGAPGEALGSSDRQSPSR